jgi:hypothetical protein
MTGINLGARAPLPVKQRPPLVRTKSLATQASWHVRRKIRWRHRWLHAAPYDVRIVHPPPPPVVVDITTALTAPQSALLVRRLRWRHKWLGSAPYELLPPAIVPPPQVLNGPSVVLARRSIQSVTRTTWVLQAPTVIGAAVILPDPFPGIRGWLVLFSGRPATSSFLRPPILVAAEAMGGTMVVTVRRPRPRTVSFLNPPVVVS